MKYLKKQDISVYSGFTTTLSEASEDQKKIKDKYVVQQYMVKPNVLFHFHVRTDAVYDLVTHVLYETLCL